VVVLLTLSTPTRSVENFCKVHSEEKARLAALPGDTWSSAVFGEKTNDASEMAKSFERLESVSPDEIKSDVELQQELFKKVDEDPSQALAASLSGIGPEENVKQWTKSNCQNNE